MRRADSQTAVSTSMDSEQVKNVVHAFLTLFSTRSKEKNNQNLLHFYGTLQLENHMNIQYILYPDKICCGLHNVTVFFLYIYIFIYFIEVKTQGKALSPKGFYVSNTWKILHFAQAGYWTWALTYEKSFPKILPAYLNVTPSSAQNLFLSLHLMQIALAWRFSNITWWPQKNFQN